jgi:hypothetical protein
MGPIPLYPVYIRGIAYRAVNRGGEAASEFQKILRPSRACAQLAHRRIGSSPDRQSLCHARRHRESSCRLSRFPHAMERRRSRHLHSEASQGGVRQAAVKPCSFVLFWFSAEAAVLWFPFRHGMRPPIAVAKALFRPRFPDQQRV